MEQDCIFCKIVASEDTKTVLYEDGLVIAFLDIAPVNPGHTLVVPKKHFDNILETPDEYITALLSATKKIAPAIRGATGAEGFNLSFNTGEVAGQTVFHTHLHITPRHKDDGFKLWPQKSYKEGEAEKLAEEVKKLL